MDAAATISLPQLRAFCRDAFERAGLSGPDAGTGAEVLSTTDAWGVFTHGSRARRVSPHGDQRLLGYRR